MRYLAILMLLCACNCERPEPKTRLVVLVHCPDGTVKRFQNCFITPHSRSPGFDVERNAFAMPEATFGEGFWAESVEEPIK